MTYQQIKYFCFPCFLNQFGKFQFMRNMNKCLFVKMGLNKGKVKSRICLAKHVFHEVWKDLFLNFWGVHFIVPGWFYLGSLVVQRGFRSPLIMPTDCNVNKANLDPQKSKFSVYFPLLTWTPWWLFITRVFWFVDLFYEKHRQQRKEKQRVNKWIMIKNKLGLSCLQLNWILCNIPRQ